MADITLDPETIDLLNMIPVAPVADPDADLPFEDFSSLFGAQSPMGASSSFADDEETLSGGSSATAVPTPPSSAVPILAPLTSPNPAPHFDSSFLLPAPPALAATATDAACEPAVLPTTLSMPRHGSSIGSGSIGSAADVSSSGASPTSSMEAQPHHYPPQAAVKKTMITTAAAAAAAPKPKRNVNSRPKNDAPLKRLKREERLRRNRESAQRSRIRQKARQEEAEQELTNLRNTATSQASEIKRLKSENAMLREQLNYFRAIVARESVGLTEQPATAAPAPIPLPTSTTTPAPYTAHIAGGVMVLAVVFSFAICFVPGLTPSASGGLSEWGAFTSGSSVGVGQLAGSPIGSARGILTDDPTTMEPVVDVTPSQPPVPPMWSPTALVAFALYAVGMHQVARTVLTYAVAIVVVVLGSVWLSRANSSPSSSSAFGSPSSGSSGAKLLPSSVPRPTLSVSKTLDPVEEENDDEEDGDEAHGGDHRSLLPTSVTPRVA